MKKLLTIIILSFCFVLLSFVPCFLVSAYADDVSNIELITGVELLEMDGVTPLGTDIPKDKSFKLHYDFTIKSTDLVEDGDTFTMTIPDEILITNNITSTIREYDPDGPIVMTTELATSKSITLTFTEYAYNEGYNKTDIVGHLWYELAFDENNIGRDDPTNIEFNVGATGAPVVVQVDFDQPPLPDATMTKSSSYDKSSKEITWTFIANSEDVPVEDMQISDTLAANHEFVPGSVMVYNGSTYEAASTDDYDYNTSTREFLYTFPSSPVTEEQRIRLRTVVPNDVLLAESTAQLSVTNDAELLSGGAPTDTATVTENIPINLISKEGSFDRDNDEIDWTITVNESLLDIDGATVTETLETGLTFLPDTLRYSTVAGAVPVGSTAGTYEQSDQDLTFYLGDIDSTDGVVTIEFSTEVTQDIYQTQVTESFENTVTLAGVGVVANNTASDGVAPPSEIMNKTAPSYDPKTGILTWNIEVNPYDTDARNVPLNSVSITDSINLGQEYVDGSFEISEDGSGTYSSGTFEYVNVEDANESTVGNTGAWTYTFPVGNIVETYNITFETQIKDKNVYMSNSNNRFYNTANILLDGTLAGSDTANRLAPSEVLDKIAGTYEYDTKQMNWTIDLNDNEMELNSVVVTDEIALGQEYVENSFSIKDTSGNDYNGGAFNFVDVADSAEESTGYTGTITYAFPSGGTINKKYIITYKTDFKNLELLEDNRTITLSNSVNLDHNDLSGSLEDGINESASRNFTSDIISKTAAYTNGEDFIDWDITVNRNEIFVASPVIYDTLQEGLSLDTSSIELYELTVNQNGTTTQATTPETISGDNISYNKDTRQFNFSFLRNITGAYSLEFRTDITDKTKSPFTNSSSLDGGTINDDGEVSGVAVQFSGAGGSASGGVGSITIKKVDENDNSILLQGAYFELIDKYDIAIADATTDSNGEAFFDFLKFGQTYTVREVTPPVGYYNVGGTDYTFTVDSGNKDITYTFTNAEIKGNLSFTKVDEDSNVLAGAEFALYESDGTSTGITATSDADGTVTFSDVSYGDYYVQETDAPTGYDVNNTHYEFSIENDGVTVGLDNATENKVENRYARGDITFVKIDENSQPLQGAVFSIYSASDTSFSTPLKPAQTSAANGVVTFTELLAGNYVIREESVPDGYISAPNQTATINIDGDDVNLGNILNENIEVVLNKVTKDTTDLITAHADFRLYKGVNPSGTELQDLVMQTGNNYAWNGTTFDASVGSPGKIGLESLPDDSYYFVEVSAPVKYDLPSAGDEITPFTVGDENQILNVENKLSESVLTLTKTDGSEPITYNLAEFRMYNSADEPIMLAGSYENYRYVGVGSAANTATLLQTSATGIIRISELIYDDYYFVEVSAPYGYEEDVTAHHTITVDADTESLEITNDAKPTSDISLTKTDGIITITYNQAGFMLYTAADEPVLVSGIAGNYMFERIGIGSETAIEVFTTDDGSLNIDDVPIGDYYFVETQAPVNYTLNSIAHHRISVDGTDDSINVVNTLAPIYSLGDYVWIDADRDGVQDVGETPVDNVIVTLFDENGNQVGNPVATGSGSWESGYYNFSGLTAGEYYVVFSNLPNKYVFTSADSAADDTGDSDANVATGRTQTVLVDNTTTTANHYPHLDAGIYLDSPEIFSIGDYVWIDADEDGIQEAGEVSVNGVAVKLFRSDGTKVGASVITGAGDWDDGYYEFTGLPAGEYYVEFSNLPSGYSFTQQNIGSDDIYDSDANVDTGRTAVVVLNEQSSDENGHYPDLDAGIFFDPDHANVHIHANKLVNGYVPLESEEFGFTITRTEINGEATTGEDVYSETVYNDRGDIDINLNYDKSDVGNTYYYIIKEEDTELYGYTIDSSVIGVEVCVYIDDISVATTVIQVFEGRELTTDHTFNNKFKELTPEEIEEKGIDPIFTVNKTVDGHSVTQGEIFSFEVQQVDGNGNPVVGGFNEVVQNNSTGYAEFSQILYYAADIGKTFYYEVTEIEGSGSYTYDTSKYIATIDVTNEDPSTPAVVNVVIHDENGVEQSRMVIEDQGLEVRVPSLSFDNDSNTDTAVADADDKTDIDNDVDKKTNDDSNDLPGTATNNYLWLIIATIIIALSCVGIKGLLISYQK